MNCDPNTLMAAAKCFKCIPRGTIPEVQISLLCQWANAAGETAPQKAINPAPINGNDHVGALSVAVLPGGPTLSWANGGGATGYDVYYRVGNVGPFTPLSANQPGTTFTLPTLAYSTLYTWRIDSVNAIGTTTGDVWTFTTAQQFEWLPHATTVNWIDGGGPHTGDYNIGAGNFLATADFRTVTSISKVGSNLTSIVGTQSLPKLANLTVTTNAITVLDVRDCVSILTLNAGDNSFVGAVDVAGLIHATNVDFSNNNLLPGLTHITDLADLQTLAIFSCAFAGLIDFSFAPNLISVNANDNTLLNIALPPAGLSFIGLDADNCALVGAFDFSVFPNMVHISVAGNNLVTGIDASGLAFLLDLIFSGTVVTDATLDFTGTLNLQSFICNGVAGVTTLGFATQTQLTTLSADGSGLTNLDIGGAVGPGTFFGVSCVNCSLNQASVQNVLANLAGPSLGNIPSCDLSGGTSYAPVAPNRCIDVGSDCWTINNAGGSAVTN